MKKSIRNVLNRLLFVGLFLVGVFDVFSQGHVFKHYGVEDGLPSSEVYSAFQDSKGYMWFATDAGVCRFNGYVFENFDVSDGLTDNTVFLITEDFKGRVWFGTFNYQLSYFQNGVIYPYEYNAVLAKEFTGNRAMCSFYVDSNETIWIGNFSNGIYKLDSDGDGEFVKALGRNDWVMNMFYIEDQVIFGVHALNPQKREKIFKLKGDLKCFWNYSSKNDLLNREGEISIAYREDRFHSSSVVDHNEKVLLFVKNLMFLLVDGAEEGGIMTEVSWLDNEIIYSTNSIDTYLWICVRNKGVFKCRINNRELEVVEHLLPGISVSRVFKDRQNGYWFSTLKEGILYLSNDKMYHHENGISTIENIDIDTVKGSFYKIYDDGSVTKESLLEDVPEETIAKVGEIRFSSSSIKYNYFDGSLLSETKYYINGKWYGHKDQGIISNFISKAFLIDSNRIYKASDFGLSIVENNEEVFYSYREGYPAMWCTSLVKVEDEIWIGTKDGIRKYVNEKIIDPFGKNEYLSNTITSLAKLNDNLVLIGTKNYGLLVVKNDSVINIINENKGLVSNLIRTIHVDNQKNIWLGTSKGVCRLTFKPNNEFGIHNITEKHGLISAEIKDIASYKNIIYAVTTKGLIQFDKTKIDVNAVPPSIYISSFFVNEKETNLKTGKDFSYQENNIKIVYEALNYRSLGEVEYKYRMLGVDTTWITTTSRDVRYPALHFGEYTFQLKAKNEDGIWTETPTILNFHIQPPFWLTWWFITLIIFFIIVSVGIVFYVREKKIIEKHIQDKNKAATEKKIIELELRALRSQMNPHFIFNVLNSIQHYIIVNDFRSTNKYITSFAKLIRTVLHLSEKSKITIQEEIDMLNLYMNLETMRFDEQFSFEIDVSKSIDVNYDEIPSMLIQPYVENSIWHGLMNRKKKGEIHISLYLSENYLCCSIQDNGIGREKANEIKARRKIDQKSVGMSITKERLDLFSENDVNVITTDLKDELGNALGTKVEIKIPYKN